MKKDSMLTKFLVSFCVTTTGICFLELILGSLLMPDMRFGFDAFLMPPLFGLLTTATGLVTESDRALSTAETVVRMAIQLVLIEGIVFGVNLAAGNRYTVRESVFLAAGVAVVYVFVHAVVWLNDRRIAKAFNARLAQFQQENSGQRSAKIMDNRE